MAQKRKAAAVDVEDVSKAYTLFLDVQRSVQYLQASALLSDTACWCLLRLLFDMDCWCLAALLFDMACWCLLRLLWPPECGLCPWSGMHALARCAAQRAVCAGQCLCCVLLLCAAPAVVCWQPSRVAPAAHGRYSPRGARVRKRGISGTRPFSVLQEYAQEYMYNEAEPEEDGQAEEGAADMQQ